MSISNNKIFIQEGYTLFIRTGIYDINYADSKLRALSLASLIYICAARKPAVCFKCRTNISYQEHLDNGTHTQSYLHFM